MWDSLGAMGVLGLLVPEADGGLGLDETYLVPVLEECGRAALPHPIVETAMVAAPLLGADGRHGGHRAGTSRRAPCAMVADDILVRAGDQLWLVPADQAGRSPRQTVDRSRAAAELWWNPAEDPGGRLVADDPAVVGLAFDRGALGTAAVLVGLGQAMLDMTVALRDRAPAVRRAHRIVPGREAPPGRRRARRSSSPGLRCWRAALVGRPRRADPRP